MQENNAPRQTWERGLRIYLCPAFSLPLALRLPKLFGYTYPPDLEANIPMHCRFSVPAQAPMYHCRFTKKISYIQNAYMTVPLESHAAPFRNVNGHDPFHGTDRGRF